jgi:hypothetical protein
MDIFNEAGDKDLAKRRTVDLGSNKLHVEQKDPYGFWYIHFDKGQLPKMLEGAYTSFETALKTIELYVQQKNREIKTVKT